MYSMPWNIQHALYNMPCTTCSDYTTFPIRHALYNMPCTTCPVQHDRTLQHALCKYNPGYTKCSLRHAFPTRALFSIHVLVHYSMPKMEFTAYPESYNMLFTKYPIQFATEYIAYDTPNHTSCYTCTCILLLSMPFTT